MARSDQQAGDFLDRFLRRAQADPLQRSLGQRIQTLEVSRQMRAAFVLRFRVYLFEYQCLGFFKEIADTRGC
ncbi:MAG: hypothetical protein ABWZ38_03345 [Candidatus Binatia bacterium]